MVPWWLSVDLPNISAIIDRLKTWLVPIERSFQGLSVAIKTVRIDGELMEIWLNEVCDNDQVFTYMTMGDTKFKVPTTLTTDNDHIPDDKPPPVLVTPTNKCATKRE